MTEVFRSSELAVRAVREFDSPACVVTFDSYTDDRSLDRSGFGEDFFRSRSIDAIHFISRENDWYQYPEMPAVAETVADLVNGYKRVVAYGSSMGAYAAIRFGGMAGAGVALAISPQFSIDPRTARFEKRWKYDSERVDFSLERTLSAPFVERAYLVYDPNDVDRRHVDMFRRHTSVIDVRLPNAGHPATGSLAELGLLGDLVMDVVDDRLDVEAVSRRVADGREASPEFHYVMSGRAFWRRTRIAHAGRAAAMAPEHFGYVAHYASLLAAAGRFEEARIAFARAEALLPDHPVLLYKLSEFHERRGDIDSAIEAAGKLVSHHSETFRPRLEQLLAKRQKRYPRLGRFVAPQGARRLGERRLPVEELVTTTASPPPFVRSWARHEALLRGLPAAPVDVLLVGDSLVEYWPDHLWAPRRVLNLGVAADKTQHALWRLEQLPTGSIDCRHAVILMGANNLGADDTADGIAAGVAAVVAGVARIAPRARIQVVGTPPCGPDFRFRAEVRRKANRLLGAMEGFELLDVDAGLTGGFTLPCANYKADGIHLSEAGYKVLTRLVSRRLDECANG